MNAIPKSPTVSSFYDIPEVRKYLDRIGAEPISMRRAVIKEQRGKYWVNKAFVRLVGRTIEAPEDYAPTDLEAVSIEVAVMNVRWPSVQVVFNPPHMPDEVNKAAPEDRFEFRDTNGRLLMLQVRGVDAKGDKYYHPWTWWDDNQWRRMEPEGALPLWGLEHLNHQTTVFIHEGAKAAKFCHDMTRPDATYPMQDKLKAHPWSKELSGAAHIGWIGGAPNPARTDWAVLAQLGVKTAYIVTDNDSAGRNALATIAEQINMEAYHIQFTDEWPVGFDLADPWPAKMFKEIDGVSYYTGPAFADCVHPGTWMTNLVKVAGARGRQAIVMREHAKNTWVYVREAKLFVSLKDPGMAYTEDSFNNVMSSLSHSANFSNVLLKNYQGSYNKVCYRPDRPQERKITYGNTSAVNVFVPSKIKAQQGDIAPFEKFMAHLIPDETDREYTMKWLATLIGRPAVRILYGLLLVSETQGVGKTTLASTVLAPLVGEHNCSCPNEHTIVESQYNDWLTFKRLVICNEIYSGQSWKAYLKLKSFVTDATVEVSKKYHHSYTIENWAHFIAMSNSLRALKIEDADRRWLCPKVTETKYGYAAAAEFRDWLSSGGLSIIKWWAENRPEEYYIKEGDAPPNTTRKAEIIKESRSEFLVEVAVLADKLTSAKEPSAEGKGEFVDKPMAMASADMMKSIKVQLKDKFYDTAADVKKVMLAEGALCMPKTLKVNNRLQWVFFNEALKKALDDLTIENMEECLGKDPVKQYLARPEQSRWHGRYGAAEPEEKLEMIKSVLVRACMPTDYQLLMTEAPM